METGQFRFALRPLEIKHLFDFSLRLYRASFMPMLLSMALVQLPMTLLSLPLISHVIRLSTEVQKMGNEGDFNIESLLLEQFDSLVWAGAAMLGAMAYQMLVMPLGNLTCARLAAQNLLNEPVSFGEAVRFALSRYWATQVAIAAFLLPLLAVSVLVLLPVLVASSAQDAGGMAIAAGVGILAIFGMGIATFLLFFRFFPAVNGLIAVMEEPEGENILQQGMWYLRRSWNLTQGFYFRLLGFLVLLYFAESMIRSGINDSLRLMVMFGFELGKDRSIEDVIGIMATQDDPLQTGIVMVIAGVLTSVLPPIWQCFKLLQYVDLRCRKEGLDLELLLAENEPAAAAGQRFGAI